MQMMQQDPRVLEVYMAMQGIEVSGEPGAEGDAGAGFQMPERREPPKKEEPPPPPPDLRTPEQKEADEFKLKGNELYKKKSFEEALAMYDKAIETCPNDLTYYNNKCAVWIEMGEETYDKVIDMCKDLLLRRYEINGALSGGASFEKVAKIYLRMATIKQKRNQWDECIEFIQKALMEDNNKAGRNALREAERLKEKYDRENYFDPAKAEAHKEKGNEYFGASKWAEAKVEYDEALKRNPQDAKLFSNRAAALTKLLAYPDALRDLDQCLKLDPTFVKAYRRKGAAHFFMKEYNKAMNAYETGLKLDPTDQECLTGRDQVIAKIQETNKSGVVDEDQIRHAMADPEIQQILHDPQINMILKQMQENPAMANDALNKDPKLQEAVSKLMAAGILRVQ
jgi:stress-induced-phosphoprotein 1